MTRADLFKERYVKANIAEQASGARTAEERLVARQYAGQELAALDLSLTDEEKARFVSGDQGPIDNILAADVNAKTHVRDNYFNANIEGILLDEPGRLQDESLKVTGIEIAGDDRHNEGVAIHNNFAVLQEAINGNPNALQQYIPIFTGRYIDEKVQRVEVNLNADPELNDQLRQYYLGAVRNALFRSVSLPRDRLNDLLTQEEDRLKNEFNRKFPDNVDKSDYVGKNLRALAGRSDNEKKEAQQRLYQLVA
jgi:hypothetical protein